MALTLLPLADRGGAALAERAIAADLGDRGRLRADPDVTVDGMPFLAQAVRGRYRSIEVRAQDVDGGELVLRSSTALVSGVRVPPSLRGALPYGLRVEDVQVRQDGLAVRASATDTVLTVAPA